MAIVVAILVHTANNELFYVSHFTNKVTTTGYLVVSHITNFLDEKDIIFKIKMKIQEYLFTLI